MGVKTGVREVAWTDMAMKGQAGKPQGEPLAKKKKKRGTSQIKIARPERLHVSIEKRGKEGGGIPEGCPEKTEERKGGELFCRRTHNEAGHLEERVCGKFGGSSTVPSSSGSLTEKYDTREKGRRTKKNKGRP